MKMKTKKDIHYKSGIYNIVIPKGSVLEKSSGGGYWHDVWENGKRIGSIQLLETDFGNPQTVS